MMWVLIKAAGSVWICSDLAKCCKINRTALHSPNVSKWIVAQGVLQRNWMFINSQVRQMLEIKLKAERAMNRHNGTESGCSTEANDQKCVHKCKLQLHFNVSLFWLCLVYSCKKKNWAMEEKRLCSYWSVHTKETEPWWLKRILTCQSFCHNDVKCLRCIGLVPLLNTMRNKMLNCWAQNLFFFCSCPTRSQLQSSSLD